MAIAIRAEPNTLAGKTGVAGGVTLTTTRRLFNANLVIFDQRGTPQPYLAAELPRLNTDSWQVNPDGTMVTTYKLKPDLTWHDGQPLTAEDFVFGYHVYLTPDLGASTAPPTPSIQDVVAPDPQTLTIYWKKPYPQAGQLSDMFPPLPKHILESTFQSADSAAFAANPYWTQQYVGAGPYKLDQWVPGAYIQATAFDKHVLGAAKIPRVKVGFIGDANTVLANILSGEVQFSADDSIRFEQTLTLQKQWGPNGGQVLFKPDLWRATYFQLRRDVVKTPSLLDIRVRKALAMTVDKQGLNDGLFEGQSPFFSDVPFVPTSVDYFSRIEPLAVKYQYDPSQAQALLTQAGFSRGSDGSWSDASGKLSFDFTTTSGSQNESELSIIAAGWRAQGIEINESIFPVALAQDQQARSSFPSLMTISMPQGVDTLSQYNTGAIPRAETRWVGFNRGGWSNADFDRVAEMFVSTLDPDRRVQLLGQMEQIYTGDLASIPLFFNAIPLVAVGAVKGPQNVAPDSDIAWDIYNWTY